MSLVLEPAERSAVLQLPGACSMQSMYQTKLPSCSSPPVHWLTITQRPAYICLPSPGAAGKGVGPWMASSGLFHDFRDSVYRFPAADTSH